MSQNIQKLRGILDFCIHQRLKYHNEYVILVKSGGIMAKILNLIDFNWSQNIYIHGQSTKKKVVTQNIHFSPKKQLVD